MKKLLMILAIMAVASFANAQLIITGVVDGPLPGGVPKCIELYSCGAIDDLSIYGMGAANNGEGTDGVEFIFPAEPMAGEHVHLCRIHFQHHSYGLRRLLRFQC